MLSSQQHQPSYLQLHHLYHPHHHQPVVQQQPQQQISGNNFSALIDNAGSGSSNGGSTIIGGGGQQQQQHPQLVPGTTTTANATAFSVPAVSASVAAAASMVEPLLNNNTTNNGNNTSNGVSGNSFATLPSTTPFQSLLKPAQTTTTTTVGGTTTAALINGLQQPGAWYFSPQQQQLPPDQLDFDNQLDGSPSSPGLAMGPQQLLARFGPRHCTESVEVPSSEHVAEIVGRQGCKIKALRAKTNTYIKTPVRGEEPVFVVTGRHEDVADARREIECAAEHFTQIRASRRHSQGGCPAPGHVTAYVRVPLRVVGLVVGPKGNTIKRIQQDTHTYIITPSREREPIFEVTGLPQNVEAARREIENHIYQRTGNMPITDSNASVANYDLHAAALQAQQSAFHAQSGNRPNYGALAVSNNSNTSSRNMLLMQLQQQIQQSSPSPYQPNGATNTGADLYQLHHFNGSKFDQLHHHGNHHHLSAFTGCGGSERAASPVQPGNQHSFIDGLNGVSNGFSTGNVTTGSANNLQMLLNALELDTRIGGGGQQKPKAQLHANNMFGLQPHNHLLRSISSSNNSQLAQQRQQRLGSGTGSAFLPWNNNTTTMTTTLGNKNLAPENGLDIGTNNNGGVGKTGETVDFLDLIASSTAASPSPLFFSSSNSNGCQSTFSAASMAGLLVGGNNNNGVVGDGVGGVGGLSSIHSSSRDEGLGDSPTNSFGRPNGTDPYQHLMTIWTDFGNDQESSHETGAKHVEQSAAIIKSTGQNTQVEQTQQQTNGQQVQTSMAAAMAAGC